MVSPISNSESTNFFNEHLFWLILFNLQTKKKNWPIRSCCFSFFNCSNWENTCGKKLMNKLVKTSWIRCLFSKAHITFSIYILVHKHNKIAGAFVKGSTENENKFYEDKNLIKWFTVCPGSNEGPDTFELCIAGHDDHRLYYDSTHM